MSKVINTVNGVPLAIAQSSLNVAKGMILGAWQVNDSDEMSEKMDLKNIDLVQDQRREAGWILLEGLLKLGNQWVQGNSQLIHKLFRSAFSPKMCTLDTAALKDKKIVEVVLHEFKIKKRALACLNIFIECNKENRNSLKLIAQQYLANINSFMLPSQFIDVFTRFFPSDFIKAKTDLFDCFAKVPSEFYYKCFVGMLHPIC